MNLRWLWFDYIDPALNLSKAERRSVRKRVWRARGRFELTALMAAMSIVATILWFNFAPRIEALVQGSMPSGFPLPRSWTFFLFLAGLHIFGALCLKTLHQQTTWIAVRELGYELCTSCGYWLRGLGDDVTRCPECGAERETMPEA